MGLIINTELSRTGKVHNDPKLTWRALGYHPQTAGDDPRTFESGRMDPSCSLLQPGVAGIQRQFGNVAEQRDSSSWTTCRRQWGGGQSRIHSACHPPGRKPTLCRGGQIGPIATPLPLMGLTFSLSQSPVGMSLLAGYGHRWTAVGRIAEPSPWPLMPRLL